MQSDITEKMSVKQQIKNIGTVMGMIHDFDRSQFPLAVVVTVIMTVSNYLPLVLSAGVLNRLQRNETWPDMAGFAGKIIFASLICHVLEGYLQNSLSVKRNAVFLKYQMVQSGKLMQMDFSMVDSPMLEKIRTRMRKDNDWGSSIYSVTECFDMLISGICNLAGALILAFPVIMEILKTDNRTAIFFLLLNVVGTLVCIRIRGRMLARENAMMMSEVFDSEQERAEKTSLFGYMASEGNFSYQSGKDVRIYHAYDLFHEYTRGRQMRYEYPAYRKLGRQMGKEAWVRGGGDALFGMLPYFIAACAALPGMIQIGSLVQFAGAMSNLTAATGSIAAAAAEGAIACRRQLSTLEFLLVHDEMYKGKLPVEKRSDFEYEIEFSHVWFRYPGTKDYALKDFSLKLKIGKKLAIVGMNGSGKTTMIKLLCRLYEPQKGQILLNGVDIKKFKEDEYRRLFSVVFQDVYLFPLKLGENVAGETSYDREKVEQCLKDAGFGERLSTLSSGLDTYLYKNYDDNGAEISGGEAQKIAIARALCKEAPFILLDEPAAALDPKAEYEIYTGFDRLVGKKTAIYISHRLSSCRFCDDIAVFSEGRLVQRGSHEELVKDEDGKYFELWSAQAQYYEYPKLKEVN